MKFKHSGVRYSAQLILSMPTSGRCARSLSLSQAELVVLFQSYIPEHLQYLLLSGLQCDLLADVTEEELFVSQPAQQVGLRDR
jgi:hypothetical protein